jgi:hypothetical protein
MIQIPEHILLLIEKQLKGNPDSGETATLLQWRKEREAHESVYRQLVDSGKAKATIRSECLRG